jgi:prepilin-type N-terminal cleavage/methylation domain-containing protein/prepilin-type processing-associated H-X9-DG protein
MPVEAFAPAAVPIFGNGVSLEGAGFMARRRRAGFTLVELLVVIGIAAVMIAILIPTLGAARRQARTLVCLSNVRQLGAAYQVYLSQNNGSSFEYPGFWMPLLKPLSNQIRLFSICPEATDSSSGVGSDYESWEMSGNRGSYTFNGWLYRYDLNDPTEGSDALGPLSAYISLPTSGSNTVPIFSDGIWVNAWPHDTDTPPTNLEQPLSTSSNEMCRVCIDRHRNAVNMIFLDGHGETITLADLWQQRWSNAFVPTTVAVPPIATSQH